MVQISLQNSGGKVVFLRVVIVGSPRILKGGGLKSLKIVKGWEFTFFH